MFFREAAVAVCDLYFVVSESACKLGGFFFLESKTPSHVMSTSLSCKSMIGETTFLSREFQHVYGCIHSTEEENPQIP